MITPIIYFGLNRTGTTRLGNLLYEKLNVHAAYHELNFGVCEVKAYRINKYFKNFSDNEVYTNFLENYKYSDVFLALNGDYEYFKNKQFDSFYSFFFELIHQDTQRQNKSYWTFKLEAQILRDKKELALFNECLNTYSNKSIFIAVKRNFEDYFNSSIGLYKKANKYKNYINFIITAEYHHLYPQIEKFMEKNNGVVYKYHEMNDDRFIEKLQSYLNINKKVSIDNRVIRNSSKSSHESLFLTKLCIYLIRNISFLSFSIVNFVEYYRIKKNSLAKLWNNRIYLSIHDPHQLIVNFQNRYERILIPLIKRKYIIEN